MNNYRYSEIRLDNIAGLKKDPHDLTGGSGPHIPIVKTSCDWLEVTFPKGVQTVRPDWTVRESVEARPFSGYDTCRKYQDGHVELWHTCRPEMGCHVLWNGSSLAQYPDRVHELATVYADGGARASRIDLAVDVFNLALLPERATEEIKAGRCKTGAKAFPVTQDSVRGGYTQYVGAPSSEVRVRIYDKAQEQGIDDGDWTRIEAQFRSKRAHAALNAWTRGIEARALIAGFVDFPEWKKWQEVMRFEAVKISTERQDTNTVRWLLEQCAPALARQVHMSGDDMMLRFFDAYNREYEKLRSTDGKQEKGGS